MRKTCLDMVYELAQTDERVVFIGSDLGAGTLDAMREAMPDRFFMEGVSEANIIGMAAGMALEGYIPYVNTIATFLTRRCYEQVALDLCLHNLPVRLIASGGGLVYAPLGPTHLAIEDLAIMRALPNMTAVAPVDADEMKRFMRQTVDVPGPMYIRLGKGGDPVVSNSDSGFEIGKSIEMRAGDRVALISTGVMTNRALIAADLLSQKGISAAVHHIHTVKPLDEAAIIAAAGAAEAVVTIEEHTLVGGLGSAVVDVLADKMPRAMTPVLRLGIPDRFPDKYGSQDELLDYFGLQPAALAQSAEDFLASLAFKEAV